MKESLFWNDPEDTAKPAPAQSQRVIDLAFSMVCPGLPVDHAWDLYQAIKDRLPWFQQEPRTGLHTIYVAGSQNGWVCPQDPKALLYPAKRTRLTIRIPLNRINDALSLSSQTLDIAGNRIHIGTAKQKPLLPTDLLFARHVFIGDHHDESTLLKQTQTTLTARSIRFSKLLTGKSHPLHTAQGVINTHSLMIAGLDRSDSLRLQEDGLGAGRQFGCGLFIHHKAIKPVNTEG